MDLVILADEPLEKRVGHKYLRRIPSKRPGRKWEYIYGRESVRHREAVQIGEKLRISHAGEAGHYEVIGVHGEYATLRHDETGHEVSVRKDRLLQMFRDEHQKAAKPRWQEKRATREKRVAEANRLKTEAEKVDKWAAEHDDAKAYRIAAKAHKAAADYGADDAVWHRARQFELERAAESRTVRENQAEKDQAAERQSGILPDRLMVPFERMGKKKFKEEMGRRREANLVLRGKTYDWKEEIKKAGGVWDSWDKCWLMPSKEHLEWFRDRMNRGIQPGATGVSVQTKPSPHDEPESVGRAAEEERRKKQQKEARLEAPRPKPMVVPAEVATEVAEAEKGEKTSWSLSGGSGYGHRGYSVGQTIRTSKHLQDQGYPEFVTVTKASREYIREDGLSFGVGEDTGYYYHARVRAATDEEAAEVKKQIEAKERKLALQREVGEIAEDIREHGEYPPMENGVSHVVEGERLFDTQNIYGGGSWFVVTKDHVWYVRNNGSDGDDWSRNNVRTGGAGGIGWRVPKTDELVAKLKRAQEELGSKAGV